MIGSASLDKRPMLLNFELNVMVLSAELDLSLTEKLNNYFDKISPVRFANYEQGSFQQKLSQASLRPLVPIL